MMMLTVYQHSLALFAAMPTLFKLPATSFNSLVFEQPHLTDPILSLIVFEPDDYLKISMFQFSESNLH